MFAFFMFIYILDSLRGKIDKEIHRRQTHIYTYIWYVMTKACDMKYKQNMNISPQLNLKSPEFYITTVKQLFYENITIYSILIYILFYIHIFKYSILIVNVINVNSSVLKKKKRITSKNH